MSRRSFQTPTTATSPTNDEESPKQLRHSMNASPSAGPGPSPIRGNKKISSRYAAAISAFAANGDDHSKVPSLFGGAAPVKLKIPKAGSRRFEPPKQEEPTNQLPTLFKAALVSPARLKIPEKVRIPRNSVPTLSPGGRPKPSVPADVTLRKSPGFTRRPSAEVNRVPISPSVALRPSPKRSPGVLASPARSPGMSPKKMIPPPSLFAPNLASTDDEEDDNVSNATPTRSSLYGNRTLRNSTHAPPKRSMTPELNKLGSIISKLHRVDDNNSHSDSSHDNHESKQASEILEMMANLRKTSAQRRSKSNAANVPEYYNALYNRKGVFSEISNNQARELMDVMGSLKDSGEIGTSELTVAEIQQCKETGVKLQDEREMVLDSTLGIDLDIILSQLQRIDPAVPLGKDETHSDILDDVLMGLRARVLPKITGSLKSVVPGCVKDLEDIASNLKRREHDELVDVLRTLKKVHQDQKVKKPAVSGELANALGKLRKVNLSKKEAHTVAQTVRKLKPIKKHDPSSDAEEVRYMQMVEKRLQRVLQPPSKVVDVIDAVKGLRKADMTDTEQEQMAKSIESFAPITLTPVEVKEMEDIIEDLNENVRYALDEPASSQLDVAMARLKQVPDITDDDPETQGEVIEDSVDALLKVHDTLKDEGNPLESRVDHAIQKLRTLGKTMDQRGDDKLKDAISNLRKVGLPKDKIITMVNAHKDEPTPIVEPHLKKVGLPKDKIITMINANREEPTPVEKAHLKKVGMPKDKIITMVNANRDEPVVEAHLKKVGMPPEPIITMINANKAGESDLQKSLRDAVSRLRKVGMTKREAPIVADVIRDLHKYLGDGDDVQKKLDEYEKMLRSTLFPPSKVDEILDVLRNLRHIISEKHHFNDVANIVSTLGKPSEESVHDDAIADAMAALKKFKLSPKEANEVGKILANLRKVNFDAKPDDPSGLSFKLRNGSVPIPEEKANEIEKILRNLRKVDISDRDLADLGKLLGTLGHVGPNDNDSQWEASEVKLRKAPPKAEGPPEAERESVTLRKASPNERTGKSDPDAMNLRRASHNDDDEGNEFESVTLRKAGPKPDGPAKEEPESVTLRKAGPKPDGPPQEEIESVTLRKAGPKPDGPPKVEPESVTLRKAGPKPDGPPKEGPETVKLRKAGSKEHDDEEERESVKLRKAGPKPDGPPKEGPESVDLRKAGPGEDDEEDERELAKLRSAGPKEEDPQSEGPESVKLRKAPPRESSEDPETESALESVKLRKAPPKEDSPEKPEPESVKLRKTPPKEDAPEKPEPESVKLRKAPPKEAAPPKPEPESVNLRKVPSKEKEERGDLPEFEPETVNLKKTPHKEDDPPHREPKNLKKAPPREQDAPAREPKNLKKAPPKDADDDSSHRGLKPIEQDSPSHDSSMKSPLSPLQKYDDEDLVTPQGSPDFDDALVSPPQSAGSNPNGWDDNEPKSKSLSDLTAKRKAANKAVNKHFSFKKNHDDEEKGPPPTEEKPPGNVKFYEGRHIWKHKKHNKSIMGDRRYQLVLNTKKHMAGQDGTNVKMFYSPLSAQQRQRRSVVGEALLKSLGEVTVVDDSNANSYEKRETMMKVMEGADGDAKESGEGAT